MKKSIKSIAVLVCICATVAILMALTNSITDPIIQENERKNAQTPLHAGPFAKFLKALSTIQSEFEPSDSPIRTALVTARNAPAHERVIRTLRAWNVRIDEAFFLGGMTKRDILAAFGAHIFFDDQAVHTDPASTVVPAARVLYQK